jgi:hypothetical protein
MRQRRFVGNEQQFLRHEVLQPGSSASGPHPLQPRHCGGLSARKALP